jgi:hypothetical protein
VAGLLLHPVAHQPDALDSGGMLFMDANFVPSLASTSVVYWLLFPLGLVYLYILARCLAQGQDTAILVSFFLWLAANTIQQRVYQKYYEGFLIFFLAYALITVKSRGWLHWLGPTALSLALAGSSIVYFQLVQ